MIIRLKKINQKLIPSVSGLKVYLKLSSRSLKGCSNKYFLLRITYLRIKVTPKTNGLGLNIFENRSEFFSDK